ncbi:ADP-ribosylglycohydrolase family protein [Leucobacter sp. W1478]|uniref:ADP-ribosylglycohydrolase family protein n=1 Tax=Leucobacter sp. W1478 TaxID=3439065 RepID=UPI003F3EA499
MIASDELVYRSRVRGCLLGGAIGDALGGPVEFWNTQRILEVCGEKGVTEFLPEIVDGEARHGLITDDTQMTLFTVEGLIRAGVRTDRGIGLTVAVTHHAYDRWLDTQLMREPDGSKDGWLIDEKWLYARRAPGNTCMSALMDARGGERRIPQYGGPADNDSKGCGGVMRSAPFGLLPPRSDEALGWQFDSAALATSFTHGHPTAQLASGALAVLLGAIILGQELGEAADKMMQHLQSREHHEETTRVLQKAIAEAKEPPSIAVVESLGGGWVADEALAIAVYAALQYPEPENILKALSLAVTHSGDSDSTGAICGNILGALHGEAALPPQLVFEVEGRGTILQLADDLVYEFTRGRELHGDYGPYTRWTTRYPGW